MKKSTQTKVVGSISILLIITALIWATWYFSNITLYIIIALIITLLANPLKLLLMRIPWGSRHMGTGLASALALLGITGILAAIIVLVAPTVNKQISAITQVDADILEHTYREQMAIVDDFLHEYEIINEQENIETIITHAVVGRIKQINPASFFNNFITGLGELFLGIFSVLFISFYILKDIPKLQHTLIHMMPDKHQEETQHVLTRSKKLLSNYFVGLAVEIILVAVVEFALLSILHIDNALLIALLGGILVIIPYIGSIVACVLGCIFAVMTAYMAGPDVAIISIVLKVVGTFIFCRILDNFFLQPYIASKSVKAHPLEIFLVILISGSIAGIPGMMLGIPAYTIVRVVAQEFFGNNNFVKTLTRHLSDSDTVNEQDAQL